MNIINTTLEQAIVKEKRLNETTSSNAWGEDIDGQEVGSYVDYLGAKWRVTEPVADSERSRRATPPFNYRYALNPYACIRYIHEALLMDDLVIRFESNQIWVYPSDVEPSYMFHLAFGEADYARPQVVGVGENQLRAAFCGLLFHYKNGMMDGMYEASSR